MTIAGPTQRRPTPSLVFWLLTLLTTLRNSNRAITSSRKKNNFLSQMSWDTKTCNTHSAALPYLQHRCQQALPPARCLLVCGKAEGEEEWEEKVPATFVRGSENTIFSSAEKEASSKRCKRRPPAMAARTHMHTHFLWLHENNEVWGGRLLYKVHTGYV